MLLVPLRIESLPIERPWANWAYMAACCVISLAAFDDLLALGTVMLGGKWITLTEWDNPSLFDIVFRGKRAPPEW